MEIRDIGKAGTGSAETLFDVVKSQLFARSKEYTRMSLNAYEAWRGVKHNVAVFLFGIGKELMLD